MNISHACHHLLPGVLQGNLGLRSSTLHLSSQVSWATSAGGRQNLARQGQEAAAAAAASTAVVAAAPKAAVLLELLWRCTLWRRWSSTPLKRAAGLCTKERWAVGGQQAAGRAAQGRSELFSCA